MTFYNQFPCLTKEGRKEKHMYFSHLFQINFWIGSHASFTDEIHDPPARKVESLREVAGCQKCQTGHQKNVGNTPDVYLLMNPAIHPANLVPRIVQNLIPKLFQEKNPLQVLVLIFFHLYHFHNLLYRIAHSG